ncbi:amino acid permease [Sphingopyxis fribergensis]
MSDTPELARTLKARHISMIAIGGIIGAGLFVGSSTAIATAGPAIILSYLFAGIVILMVMRMLGEMATLHPGVGAFTEFSRLGLGNWAGFAAGWLYWYFWVMVVAIEVIAGAIILGLWLPLPVWQIGLGLLVVMTAVNLMSARSYGEFEFWFSSIKVAAILVFIAITASYAFGWGPATQGGVSNLIDHGGFAPHGWGAVLAGVTSVIFALCGAEIATIAAAESSDPAKVIARLTHSVAMRILLFYVLSIALIVIVVPWTEIAPGVSPFATALDHIGIDGASTIMNIVVLVAVLSCLNSGLYVTSRMLFTLAAKGDAPAGLVKLNRRGVPARSILIGSALGYVAVIASIVSPERVFSFLVNASGATMLIIYLLAAFAHLKLRAKSEAAGEAPPLVRMWLYPYATWATIVAMAGVLVAMAISPSLMSQFYSSLGLMLAVLAAYGCIVAMRRREASRASQEA